MTYYYRALVQSHSIRPADALPVAGGWGWFTHAERLCRTEDTVVLHQSDLPADIRDSIAQPRAAVAGMSMDRPRIMGILNVTPDSFSDGGQHEVPAQAVQRGIQLVRDGADMIDVGGESTRPGATTISIPAEIARTEPVIRALRHAMSVPISIDTRKGRVAEAAYEAGASLVNDVSGFSYDRALGPFCASAKVPVCVMHAQGDPETMQENPRYDSVLLDVYDFLAAQLVFLEGIGIPRDRVWVDPGIGFGKTQAHNLELLNRLSLFHSLGCAILLGVSRKKFIGTISGVSTPSDRVLGSVSVALAGVAQGVQVVRVHDVRETRQALSLWEAVQNGAWPL
ncbi:dihydropteroate synthase [Pseudoprimorskyibacter insulae]|uniref:Dihydropteroate synthase n=1 Tax=Pseudoprimorskyibacter insulae TaxID=1695997 RepID=A0A2R8AR06_9RHOB|nr:dihydropteroate synthase [Pseudoprimorskyibacter insulae]SPF78455.1 Dihydropteroate synthase [Pseudoprimorskyibacter insulae]